MLVYNDLTSIVARMVFDGSGVGMVKMVRKKWLVSLMSDESCGMIGLR